MQFISRYFNDIQYDPNLVFGQIKDFEVNQNLHREPVKTDFFRWTRTEPEPTKFGFYLEPEPRTGKNRFFSVDPNRTWTFKIWISEPEPNLNLKNLVSMNPNL